MKKRLVVISGLISSIMVTILFQNCNQAKFKGDGSLISSQSPTNVRAADNVSDKVIENNTDSYDHLTYEKSVNVYKVGGNVVVGKSLSLDLDRNMMKVSLKLHNGFAQGTGTSCYLDAERKAQLTSLLRSSAICEDDGALPKGLARTLQYHLPDLILSSQDSGQSRQVEISTVSNGAHLYLCDGKSSNGDHFKTNEIKLILESLILNLPIGCELPSASN
ncbi:MAG: hypothetical protein H7061_04225 [Bdellovibrionaceae bacterium]|nr:hypothetical protein [Bdellovibrio sp.]